MSPDTSLMKLVMAAAELRAATLAGHVLGRAEMFELAKVRRDIDDVARIHDERAPLPVRKS